MKTVFLTIAALAAALHSSVLSPAASVGAVPAGSIVRAQFTSAIKDREPTDSLTSAGTDKTEIYFFTELKGFSGSKITHRWEHGGKVEREQTFDIRGDRWRAWSNKTLGPRATGEWKVIVVDGTGATLGTYTLTYGK
jgi:hypothetical protein